MPRTSTKSILPTLGVCYLALVLTACGGGGHRGGAPPQTAIGQAGGTVQGPNGARVDIPATALSQPTAISVAMSSAGAPPLPAGVQAVSDIFAFTPHGTTFALPVTVTIPFDPSRVPAGVTPIVHKTNAAQDAWEPVQGATFSARTVSVQASSFSWYRVSLPQPPQITQQPQSITVPEGSGAGFDVRVVSVFDVIYQWQRASGGSFVDIAGATQRSFEIGSVTARDDGAQFRVAVNNGFGTILSAVATLTVTPASGPPVIVSAPQDQFVLPETDATFAVTATGSGLQFQWQRAADSGSNIFVFDDITGATGAIFTLTTRPEDNNSRFRVRITNSLGSVTSAAALLTVRGPVTGGRIGAGTFHSVAQLATSELVSWGSNFEFQLGAGPQASNFLRREVHGPVVTLTGVVGIAVGPLNSIAFLRNGELWGWGNNEFGELGDRGGLTRQEPQHINGVDNAIAACVGTNHSLFLFADGTVRALGSNFFGQLGDGTPVESRSTPVTVFGIESAVGIACGEAHSLAVLANGTVRAWGDNEFGQLGNGTTEGSNVPVQVHEVVGAVAVAAGRGHSLALLPSRGQTRAWGLNNAGQLGDGTLTDRLIGVLGPGVTAATAGIVQIAAGGDASIARQGGGGVLTWGSNAQGQLGVGSLDEFGDPTPRFSAEALHITIGQAPNETRVDEVAMGPQHVIVLGANGLVFTWGWNVEAQLGIGPVPSEPFIFPTPQRVLQLDLD